jgi:diacylglycerol kinase family enzyme
MTLMAKNIAVLRSEQRSPASVAVLLNQNAKKVSPRVRGMYESMVPHTDLFWSRSLDEAEDHVGRILDRGYSTVFTGGGDGTICHTVNLMHAQLGRRISRGECPSIGILKLGTGNAMAHMVGAHDPVRNLRTVMSGDRPRRMRLELIEDGSRLLPFAGIGWDAAVLNDYISVKERYGQGMGRRLFNSLFGYAAAIGLRTVPREVLRRDPTCIRVRNLGNAVHVLPDGRRLPIPKGTLLFDGACKFAGVSTVPFYGYGMKVFPHAGTERGRMHLRIVTMSVWETLSRLPGVWKGTYTSPGILDFLIDEVEIESEEPVPYQVGGDAQGMRQKLAFRMSPRTVELLDFRPQA